MFWRSKLNIALFLLPIILLGPLLYVTSWRPHAIKGVNGAAGISAPASAIAYGPDGTLVCLSTNGNLQTYLPEEKRWRSYLPPLSPSPMGLGRSQYRSVPRIAFSKDGKTVFSTVALVSEVSTIQAFDTKSRRPLYSFGTPFRGVFDLSGDGRWAAFGTFNTLVVLDLDATPLPQPKLPLTNKRTPQSLQSEALLTRKDFRSYPSQSYSTKWRPSSVSFSPDSKTLAIGFNDQIALFDVGKGSLKPRVQTQITNTPKVPGGVGNVGDPAGNGSPFWLEWSPDGTMLASYSPDRITIFDPTLSEVASIQQYLTGQEGANLVWSKDGKSIFTGGLQASRWNLGDTKVVKLRSLRAENNYNASGPVALSPDEKYLLTPNRASSDSYPTIWQWRLR